MKLQRQRRFQKYDKNSSIFRLLNNWPLTYARGRSPVFSCKDSVMLVRTAFGEVTSGTGLGRLVLGGDFLILHAS
jgi:hypothetical protein